MRYRSTLYALCNTLYRVHVSPASFAFIWAFRIVMKKLLEVFENFYATIVVSVATKF